MSRIYVLNDSGLQVMDNMPYASEDQLQELLERFPELLAETHADASERPNASWLLVKREMEVPDAEDGSGRWSLDHLFVDREAILTLVEVKRATDTRARREVVAQMLDYAANAEVYWPLPLIVNAFQETTVKSGLDPSEVLSRFLGGNAENPATTAEEFWSRVRTNLKAGRIRLLFVADVIPPELRRIVEFLDGQMQEAEVVAVEIRKFEGQGIRAIVPTLVGRTERAKAKLGTGVREGTAWKRESFMAEAVQRVGPEVAGVFDRIISCFAPPAAGVKWGNGKEPTFTTRVNVAGEDTEVFRVYADGLMQVAFGKMPNWIRPSLRSRLGSIAGFELSDKTGYAAAKAAALVHPTRWTEFEATVRWLLDELAKVDTGSNQLKA